MSEYLELVPRTGVTTNDAFAATPPLSSRRSKTHRRNANAGATFSRRRQAVVRFQNGQLVAADCGDEISVLEDVAPTSVSVSSPTS